jgi:MoaA/NifB/PqqE/SkfB family radical SAM enzyme
MQLRLSEPTVKYSLGPHNRMNEDYQEIRLTEGCPHNCAWCYEPTEIKVFDRPKIERRQVKVFDMNLLCKPEAPFILRWLERQKVDGKVVHYEMVCGFDYRFITEEIAKAIKAARFKDIRIAWDGSFREQIKIKGAIDHLKMVGYASRDIMVFMICNHESHTAEENLRKLDLCKVWGVAVADCYFDNQLSPNIIPIGWNDTEIKDFRRRCRKHNQLINFGIDPEVSR